MNKYKKDAAMIALAKELSEIKLNLGFERPSPKPPRKCFGKGTTTYKVYCGKHQIDKQIK